MIKRQRNIHKEIWGRLREEEMWEDRRKGGSRWRGRERDRCERSY